MPLVSYCTELEATTNYFSGPGRTTGLVCVSACVSEMLNKKKTNRPKFTILWGHLGDIAA